MSNWNDYFFEICDVIAKKSKDKSTKVGAVIVNTGNSIISTGYNGFPIGVDDSIENRFERPQKYLWTAHAEENAICFAARNGVSLNGATLYVNRLLPCSKCTRMIIQAGIKKVYAKVDTDMATNQRWKEENAVATAMLKEAGVELIDINNDINICLCCGDIFYNKYDNQYYIVRDIDMKNEYDFYPREISETEAKEYAEKENIQIKKVNIVIAR